MNTKQDSDRQIHDLTAHKLVVYKNSSYGDRQIEPPWSGAAGVEVKHTVSHFLFRLVAVAAYHGCKPRSFRLELELTQIMEDIERYASDFEDIARRNLPRPSRTIYIAAHRSYRSDPG